MATKRVSRDPQVDALKTWLASLGYPEGKGLRDTARRVAKLWRETLLAGENLEPRQVLGERLPAPGSDPIALTNLGIHLVCPHHLTVAFGLADIAYVPGPHVAGLGALSRLVQLHCARLVLQETATCEIAQALTRHLEARAALVVIRADHPCHRLTRPRDHSAHLVTTAYLGPERYRSRLSALLSPICLSSPRPRPTRPQGDAPKNNDSGLDSVGKVLRAG